MVEELTSEIKRSSQVADGRAVCIPEGYREWSGPEEKGQTVEVPDVELVVERACKHHSHQVGGKQHQEHV